MMDNDKDFGFVSCWTCKFSVYDIAVNSYRCTSLNTSIRRADLHRPTQCKKYIDNRNHNVL